MINNSSMCAHICVRLILRYQEIIYLKLTFEPAAGDGDVEGVSVIRPSGGGDERGRTVLPEKRIRIHYFTMMMVEDINMIRPHQRNIIHDNLHSCFRLVGLNVAGQGIGKRSGFYTRLNRLCHHRMQDNRPINKMMLSENCIHATK